jgi:hypothetical protein
MYMMCADNRFLGLVPALRIRLGSLEVKAGIKENPPELTSILPVCAGDKNGRNIRTKKSSLFFILRIVIG